MSAAPIRLVPRPDDPAVGDRAAPITSWSDGPRALMTAEETVLERTYAAFNARDIDAVLAVMHPDVIWPNGMEGGSVVGHAAVRAYWTRQWTLIDPRVEPRGFASEADGRLAVTVHQLVRDLVGTFLKEAIVEHVYAIEDGLIKSMEIRA